MHSHPELIAICYILVKKSYIAFRFNYVLVQSITARLVNQMQTDEGASCLALANWAAAVRNATGLLEDALIGGAPIES